MGTAVWTIPNSASLRTDLDLQLILVSWPSVVADQSHQWVGRCLLESPRSVALIQRAPFQAVHFLTGLVFFWGCVLMTSSVNSTLILCSSQLGFSHTAQRK